MAQFLERGISRSLAYIAKSDAKLNWGYKMSNWTKWVWPAEFSFNFSHYRHFFMKLGPVEEELTGRASEALNTEHRWANVSLDGRDLTLSGTAPTEAAKIEALKLADDAYDVRVVDDRSELLALAMPYDFGADIDGDAITLRGHLPNETARTVLIEATQASIHPQKL